MEVSYEGAERAACNLDDSLNSLITIDRWPSDQGPVPLPRSRAVVKLRLLRAQRREEEARFHLMAAKMRADYIRRETALLEEEEFVDSHISASCKSELRHDFQDLDGEDDDGFIVKGRGRSVPPVPKPRSIPPPQVSAATRTEDIASIVSAIKGASAAPNANLFRFDGDPKEYYRSMCTFRARIDGRNISENDKLMELLNMCTGCAYDAIKNLCHIFQQSSCVRSCTGTIGRSFWQMGLCH